MTLAEALDRLDGLAEKVTPGPRCCKTWGSEQQRMGGCTIEGAYKFDIRLSGVQSWPDGEFIAALDPATVRAIVAAVRAGMAMRIEANYSYPTKDGRSAMAYFDTALEKLNEK